MHFGNAGTGQVADQKLKLYRSQGFSHVARSCFYGPSVEGASSTAFIWDMLLLDSRKAKYEKSTATMVAKEAYAGATEVEGE
jgi:hypothetical protein